MPRGRTAEGIRRKAYKQGHTMKRQRRNRNKGKSNNPNRSYDSQGPDVKVRGNPQTVYERYMQLARDAMSAGNRVRAENLFQHAEHYLRLNQEIQAEKDKRDAERQQNQNPQRNDNDAGDDQPRSRRRNRRDRDDAQPALKAETKADAEDIPTSFSSDDGVVADVKPVRRRRPKVEAEDGADIPVEVKSTRRRRAPARKSEPAAE